MRRRTVLRGFTAGSLTSSLLGLAGCVESEPVVEPTPTPTPAVEIPAVDGQWPMARYDAQNTGSTPDTQGPQTVPTNRVLVDLGVHPEEYLTLTDSQLYAKQGETLDSYDRETGETRWSGDATTNGLGLGTHYRTPIVIDDRVVTARSLAGGLDASIGAAAAKTGAQIWKHQFDANDITPHSAGGQNGRIHLATNEGSVFTFTTDGELVWENTLDGISGQIDTMQAPISVSGEHGAVFGNNGTVSGFDTADGTPLPEVDILSQHIVGTGETLETAARFSDDNGIERQGDVGTGGIALADGAAYVVSRPNGRSNARVHRVNLASGEIQWSRLFTEDDEEHGVRDWLPSAPAVDDTHVYVNCKADIGGDEPSRTDNLFAFSRSDGSIAWSVPTGYNGTTIAPAVAGDTVYSISTTTNPSPEDLKANLILAHTTDTGTERWHATVEGNVKTAPVLHDGTIYVGTRHRGWSATNRICALS